MIFKNNVVKLSPADLILYILLAIFLVFIPIISIITLTPKLSNSHDVLGINHNNVLQMNIYQTDDPYFSTKIKQINSKTYILTTYLKPITSEYYSQNLIRIINNSDNPHTISISGYPINSKDLTVGYKLNNTNYLTSIENEHFTYSKNIEPHQSINVEALIRTDIKTNYYHEIYYTFVIE